MIAVEPPAHARTRRPSGRGGPGRRRPGRKRRRTGSRAARSSTWAAVSLAEARSSSSATTPRRGFVWRSDRSASRTRMSGVRSAPSTSDPSSAKVACTSGAKDSTSGHITRMSRGSRVGSSARACRIASRTTSTWRPRPWQAWISRLRSAGSSGTRSSGRPPSGAPAAAGRPARRPGAGRAGCRPPRRAAGGRRGPPARQHELHLARVPPPGAEQGVERHPGAAVVGAEPRPRALREGADALPQRGRGVEQEEVDLAVSAMAPSTSR